MRRLKARRDESVYFIALCDLAFLFTRRGLAPKTGSPP